MKIPYERKIAEILSKDSRTLSVAESCTGGLVSGRITGVPGSSRYFRGGVIAYSNDIKASLLGVPHTVLEKYGAVSPQAARIMAEGVRELMRSDISASITGIAGPSGGTAGKPVGLAYIGILSGEEYYGTKVLYKGGRTTIRDDLAQAALKLLYESIQGPGGLCRRRDLSGRAQNGEKKGDPARVRSGRTFRQSER